MNELELIFEKIEKNYDLNDLFSAGPYNRYENTKRIYFDNIKKRGIDRFLFLIELIEKYMRKQFSDSIYICLIDYDFTYQKKLPKKKVSQFEYTGIKIPKLCAKRDFYDMEAEWYIKLHFFEENIGNIKKYLWGSLAGNFSDIDIQPILRLDIYFISKDLSTLINIYNDRGMDIMKLNIK